MPKTRDPPVPPLLLAIEGPSGAGKSAVARELARRLGSTALPEAFERLGGRVTLEYNSRSELVELELRLLAEESRRFSEAIDRRGRGECVVLDTGFLGPATYTWGLREGGEGEGDPIPELIRAARDLLGDGRFGLPDLTVYLDLPEAMASDRALRDPIGHPVALQARHRAVGRFERFLYEREFPRCLPARFTATSGEEGPQEISRALLDRLERIGPVPSAAPEETERLFALFDGPAFEGPSSAWSDPSRYRR